MRKSKWIGLTAFAFALAASAGVHSVCTQVKADPNMQNFVISAPSVRLDDPIGLRFKVDCPTTQVTEAYTKLTFISRVVTSENPEGQSKTYVVDVSADVWRTEGDGWNTVLLGIPSSDYATEIMAQAFVTLDGVQYQTSAVTTSIAQTASEVLNLGETSSVLDAYVDNQVSNISLNKTSVTLEKDETATLVATTNPDGFAVVWKSSDTTVATVDKDGKVTAVGAGDAVISASMGGALANCNVTVTAPAQAAVAPLSVHFPQFGNRTSGDCTLIKVGNTEVLIDAGSTRGSADRIIPYIQQYCTDGILEYVIATHAHSDHISAFVGDDGTDGVFANFECKTIIDFPKTGVTTQVYKDYKTWRDKEVTAGAVHYTALDCWNNIGGAQRSYTLGEGVTLNILYQKYYETSTSNENDYSVCTLISQGENHYLFTGDLEENGEASLVQSNTLPKCKLFKAGHHGSKTANTEILLDVIEPEVVVATCCCGDGYGFPHQEFIDNVAEHTDSLYIPSYFGSSTFVLLNGHIIVASTDGKTVTVTGSNNNLKFKDTDWFKNNRTLPAKWATT